MGILCTYTGFLMISVRQLWTGEDKKLGPHTGLVTTHLIVPSALDHGQMEEPESYKWTLENLISTSNLAVIIESAMLALFHRSSGDSTTRRISEYQPSRLYQHICLLWGFVRRLWDWHQYTPNTKLEDPAQICIIFWCRRVMKLGGVYLSRAWLPIWKWEKDGCSRKGARFYTTCFDWILCFWHVYPWPVNFSC